jgi:hypothetical protein
MSYHPAVELAELLNCWEITICDKPLIDDVYYYRDVLTLKEYVARKGTFSDPKLWDDKMDLSKALVDKHVQRIEMLLDAGVKPTSGLFVNHFRNLRSASYVEVINTFSRMI